MADILHSQALGKYKFDTVSEDYDVSYKQIDGPYYLFAFDEYWIVGVAPFTTLALLHAPRGGVLPPSSGWQVDDNIYHTEDTWILDPQLTVVPEEGK